MDAQQSRPSTAAREGAMVTVVLEPYATEYKVYKALLVEHSEYFRKALTGPWKEAEDRVFRIADVKSHTFDVFVDWLYTQRLPESRMHWCPDPDRGEQCNMQLGMAYVQAYVFGDRFQTLGFKDAVGQKLCDDLDHSPPSYETVIYAYAHLPEEDDLLQQMVNFQCAYGNPLYDDDVEEIETRKRLPTDFLVRVMVCFGDLGEKVPILADEY
ncbi:hypothetical protein EKO04_008149 [Ascochyta lentis]|uniref:BTB domain-containing protein n=1 Tax=Ascochyta lentis TaxID=205686 RepID=A0A8H7IWS3_9PLEO|nr:hypothetical protein EKO04_008149 [Ascochyta lentis]